MKTIILFMLIAINSYSQSNHLIHVIGSDTTIVLVIKVTLESVGDSVRVLNPTLQPKNTSKFYKKDYYSLTLEENQEYLIKLIDPIKDKVRYILIVPSNPNSNIKYSSEIRFDREDYLILRWDNKLKKYNETRT